MSNRLRGALASPLLLVSLLACAGIAGPSFEATNPALEDSPMGFLAGGATVSCAVKNLGAAAAPATVTFTLRLGDGTVVSGEEYAMLDPKESKAVTHKFNQVRVGDRTKARVECSAAPAK